VTKYNRKDLQRALALVHKIARGLSNDEMLAVYRGLIETGGLRMKKVPHQNTLCRWMNDPRLTPILQDMVAVTAKPFRAIETAGMVDSSKMSQVRSAHSRWIEYGDDERDTADWMKLHALVGVETLVCMAAMFSGTKSEGGKYLVHDSNFMLPLVDKIREVFGLRYLLADKAYLSEKNVGGLWERGIQAVIPIKKTGTSRTQKRSMSPSSTWYAGTTRSSRTSTSFTVAASKSRASSRSSSASRRASAGPAAGRGKTKTATSSRSRTRSSRATHGSTKRSAKSST
jgi:hypothetical protein